MAKVISIPNTPYVCLEGDNCISQMCLNMGTLSCQKWIEEIPEIKCLLKPGIVVIDVGAYIGDTARAFLDHGCDVYAFECVSDALACLRHNCHEAIIMSEPVGDGRSVIMTDHSAEVSEVGNCGGRFVVDGGDVVTFRLDELTLQKCDFIKIDVEGAEPMVLDGAKMLIERLKPIILTEHIDGASKKFGYSGSLYDLTSRLHGYEWRQITGNSAMGDVLFLPK